MYIKCPNCQTTYKIKAHTLPPQGKNMRCAKCHHVWKALPPPDEKSPQIEKDAVDYSAFRFAFERPHIKRQKSAEDLLSAPDIWQILIVIIMLCITFYTCYYFI